jgi:hypothetical protein
VLADNPVIFTVALNGVLVVLSVPLVGLTCNQEGVLDDVTVKLAVPELTVAEKLWAGGALLPIW